MIETSQNDSISYISATFVPKHRQFVSWLSCSELELYEALMSCIQIDSDESDLTKELIRGKYGEMFADIRIGSIKMENFGIFIGNYKMLYSIDEFADMVQLITDDEYESKIFSGDRRQRSSEQPWEKCTEVICDRLSKISSAMPYHLKNVDTTTFSSNDPLLLIEIALNQVFELRNVGYSRMADIPTEVTIVESAGDGAQEKILAHGSSKLRSATYSLATLPRPILIKSGYLYRIQSKQTVPENCVTDVILKPFVQLESDTVIQFHHESNEMNETAHGLVLGFKFYQIPGFYQE